jgi:hypothetical protein
VTAPAASPTSDSNIEYPIEASAAESERLDAIKSRSISALTASSRSTEVLGAPAPTKEPAGTSELIDPRI